MHSALIPDRQAGTRFTYPEGMEGRVDLSSWSQMYRGSLPACIHPST